MPILVATITTCGNRFEQARRSVPSWLAQRTGRSIHHEVIVVDYASPERVCDWCASFNDPRLKSVRVEREPGQPFHLTHARNVGAAASDAELLCFSDIDLIWSVGWLQRYVAETVFKDLDLLCANCEAEPRRWQPAFFGLCIIRRDAFNALRGFDEAFTGWGYEDVDLYERARVHNFRCSWLSDDVEHLPAPADTASRTANQGNIDLVSQPRRVVNPHGYGRLP